VVVEGYQTDIGDGKKKKKRKLKWK